MNEVIFWNEWKALKKAILEVNNNKETFDLLQKFESKNLWSIGSILSLCDQISSRVK